MQTKHIYIDLLSNGGVKSILTLASDTKYNMKSQPDNIVNQILNARKCITYISDNKFKIEGYELFEIPLDNYFVFYNKVKEEMFDLVVNSGVVTPAYLDKDGTCKDAESIENAIELYIKPF